MSETAVNPMNGHLKYKLIAGLFFLALFYFANRAPHEPAKSASQTQYETWLTETEAKSKASLTFDSLPALSLAVIPKNRDEQTIEKTISSTNVSNAKDKILRLLSLINEAELYTYQTEAVSPAPGDIIIKIQSPTKTFHLQFNQTVIEKNIKAALMLKLFEEFYKDHENQR